MLITALLLIVIGILLEYYNPSIDKIREGYIIWYGPPDNRKHKIINL